MSAITKSGIDLVFGPNSKREPGRIHEELHAPCGCASHERPAPHWHQCPMDWLDKQRKDEVQWSGHPKDEPELLYCYWQIEAKSYDIRSAIDAAIAAEKSKA